MEWRITIYVTLGSYLAATMDVTDEKFLQFFV